MLLVIQCDARVPSGLYGEFLLERKIPQQLVRLFDGDSLPSLESVSGALILGGYMGVGGTDEYPWLVSLKDWLRTACESGLPMFGICLGGQLLAEVTGGRVHSQCNDEHGLLPVTLTAEGRLDPLLAGIPVSFVAFQWHNDCFTPPVGAALLATSADCNGQIFRFHNAYGLQFHPEVDAVIVAEWAEAAGQPQHAADFSRLASELRPLSLRLFVNFLTEFILP